MKQKKNHRLAPSQNEHIQIPRDEYERIYANHKAYIAAMQCALNNNALLQGSHKMLKDIISLSFFPLN
ncbi:MAG: hypothetical protein R2831_10925 [Chitinophagaceae bacterium]